MAGSSTILLLLLLSLFLLPLFLSSSAEMSCEELPQDLCAFAISSSSKRCVLEVGTDGEHQCKTSEVVVEKMSDLIETDECVWACGFDRNVVGISSDALLDADFTGKLCSPACHSNCPNIINLYFNLAAAEGASLDELCEGQRSSNSRRSMASLLLSSGSVQPPTSSSSSSAVTDKESAAAPSPFA